MSDKMQKAKGIPQEEYIMSRLAWVESSSNRWAYNKKTSATGLFQIVTNPSGALIHYNTFKGKKRPFKGRDMYNIKKSKKVAVWTLRQLRKAFPGDLPRAIVAYNAGLTRTKEGAFYTNYVTKILGEEYMHTYFINKGVNHVLQPKREGLDKKATGRKPDATQNIKRSIKRLN